MTPVCSGRKSLVKLANHSVVHAGIEHDGVGARLEREEEEDGVRESGRGMF